VLKRYTIMQNRNIAIFSFSASSHRVWTSPTQRSLEAYSPPPSIGWYVGGEQCHQLELAQLQADHHAICSRCESANYLPVTRPPNRGDVHATRGASRPGQRGGVSALRPAPSLIAEWEKRQQR
jgi:hypothetical protein